jgi:hypothetical protein
MAPWVIGIGALVVIFAARGGGSGGRTLAPLPSDPALTELETARLGAAQQAFSALTDVRLGQIQADVQGVAIGAQRDAALARIEAERNAAYNRERTIRKQGVIDAVGGAVGDVLSFFNPFD